MDSCTLAAHAKLVTTRWIREIEGIGPVSTPKSDSIRAFVEGGHLRLGLFDERNLLETSPPEHSGERLVAWRNPNWRSYARTSAKTCWRPPSATL